MVGVSEAAAGVRLGAGVPRDGTNRRFVTYAWEPSGVMATSAGYWPTGIVATTFSVAVLMTETVSEPMLVT